MRTNRPAVPVAVSDRAVRQHGERQDEQRRAARKPRTLQQPRSGDRPEDPDSEGPFIRPLRGGRHVQASVIPESLFDSNPLSFGRSRGRARRNGPRRSRAGIRFHFLSKLLAIPNLMAEIDEPPLVDRIFLRTPRPADDLRRQHDQREQSDRQQQTRPKRQRHQHTRGGALRVRSWRSNIRRARRTRCSAHQQSVLRWGAVGGKCEFGPGTCSRIRNRKSRQEKRKAREASPPGPSCKLEHRAAIAFIGKNGRFTRPKVHAMEIVPP